MTGTASWTDEKKQFVWDLKTRGLSNEQIVRHLQVKWPCTAGKDWTAAAVKYAWAQRNKNHNSGMGPTSSVGQYPQNAINVAGYMGNQEPYFGSMVPANPYAGSPSVTGPLNYQQPANPHYFNPQQQQASGTQTFRGYPEHLDLGLQMTQVENSGTSQGMAHGQPSTQANPDHHGASISQHLRTPYVPPMQDSQRGTMQQNGQLRSQHLRAAHSLNPYLTGNLQYQSPLHAQLGRAPVHSGPIPGHQSTPIMSQAQSNVTYAAPVATNNFLQPHGQQSVRFQGIDRQQQHNVNGPVARHIPKRIALFNGRNPGRAVNAPQPSSNHNGCPPSEIPLYMKVPTYMKVPVDQERRPRQQMGSPMVQKGHNLEGSLSQQNPANIGHSAQAVATNMKDSRSSTNGNFGGLQNPGQSAFSHVTPRPQLPVYPANTQAKPSAMNGRNGGPFPTLATPSQSPSPGTRVPRLSSPASVSPATPAGQDGDQHRAKKPRIVELHHPTFHHSFVFPAGGGDAWSVVAKQLFAADGTWINHPPATPDWTVSSEEIVVKIFDPVFLEPLAMAATSASAACATSSAPVVRAVAPTMAGEAREAPGPSVQFTAASQPVDPLSMAVPPVPSDSAAPSAPDAQDISSVPALPQRAVTALSDNDTEMSVQATSEAPTTLKRKREVLADGEPMKIWAKIDADNAREFEMEAARKAAEAARADAQLEAEYLDAVFAPRREKWSIDDELDNELGLYLIEQIERKEPTMTYHT